MKRIIPISALACCLVVFVGCRQPQTTDVATKAENIRQLLGMMNSVQLGSQILGQIIAGYKAECPSVPQSYWDTLTAEMSHEVDKLIGQLVPVYDRHFTNDEIKGLIAFYRTPLGMKLVVEQVPILQETYSTGDMWGRGIDAKIVKRLQTRNFLKVPKQGAKK